MAKLNWLPEQNKDENNNKFTVKRTIQSQWFTTKDECLAQLKKMVTSDKTIDALDMESLTYQQNDDSKYQARIVALAYL